MISRRIILLGVICLVLLVGILIWTTQDHENALESREQPVTKPNEQLKIANEGDTIDLEANTTDTTLNVSSEDAPLKLPEQPGESFADSQPLAAQTVSKESVADQTSDNLPEVPPGTLLNEPNIVTRLRESIQTGPYGQISPKALVDVFVTAEGSQLQDLYVALSVRKYEVLPLIFDKLQTGSAAEKRKVTKLLRHGNWQELAPVLVELALSDNEHEVSRVGALYALGATGERALGGDIATILDKPDRSLLEKRIAMSTLARIGYQEAAPQIGLFLNHENTYVRIFAARALAELGQIVDPSTLFSFLQEKDYAVREEACGALGSVGGENVIAELERVAREDDDGAVREAAKTAALRARTKVMTNPEKASFLFGLASDEDRVVRKWAIRSLATECGREGIDQLRKVAEWKRPEAQDASFYLVVQSGQ